MPEIEHVMVELLSGYASRQNVYILNVYSSPSHHKQRFKRLFQKAIRLAGSNLIVLAGDINTAHRTWKHADDRRELTICLHGTAPCCSGPGVSVMMASCSGGRRNLVEGSQFPEHQSVRDEAFAALRHLAYAGHSARRAMLLMTTQISCGRLHVHLHLL
ncbi:hypothetical protein HPB49_010343 [Dermacentor silvarum]|uniref:Uncharacterized protein n=1 Tax=Dermacentor silvarum TaxID=543639 RepID=A0ACB8DZ99_DERSI|nr:hypothetical protein HPB49_010343 [Dermacentor silvarum]